MAEIFVLGAGLGGTLMAYELVPQLREGDRITLMEMAVWISSRSRKFPHAM